MYSSTRNSNSLLHKTSHNTSHCFSSLLYIIPVIEPLNCSIRRQTTTLGHCSELLMLRHLIYFHLYIPWGRLLISCRQQSKCPKLTSCSVIQLLQPECLGIYKFILKSRPARGIIMTRGYLLPWWFCNPSHVHIKAATEKLHHLHCDYTGLKTIPFFKVDTFPGRVEKSVSREEDYPLDFISLSIALPYRLEIV